mmetsp:Transcript_17703/g.20392  ORF Transcript_17703/g.20392 Transcript_17703/m.20392 type:complete len:202 (+) Transcript_17703:1884-2489(+)
MGGGECVGEEGVAESEPAVSYAGIGLRWGVQTHAPPKKKEIRRQNGGEGGGWNTNRNPRTERSRSSTTGLVPPIQTIGELHSRSNTLGGGSGGGNRQDSRSFETTGDRYAGRENGIGAVCDYQGIDETSLRLSGWTEFAACFCCAEYVESKPGGEYGGSHSLRHYRSHCTPRIRREGRNGFQATKSRTESVNVGGTSASPG